MFGCIMGYGNGTVLDSLLLFWTLFLIDGRCSKCTILTVWMPEMKNECHLCWRNVIYSS